MKATATDVRTPTRLPTSTKWNLRNARSSHGISVPSSVDHKLNRKHNEVDGTTTNAKLGSPEFPRVRNIESIELGVYEIQTWYYSPFPDDFKNESKLYVCDVCLKYMKRKETLDNHKVSADSFQGVLFLKIRKLTSEMISSHALQIDDLGRRFIRMG